MIGQLLGFAALFSLGALLLSQLVSSPPAAAAGLAAAYCANGAAFSERPLPAALASAAASALAMDAGMIKIGAFYRCSRGRLLVCAVGANLSCGKANTGRNPPSVVDYCRRNPDARLVPMAVTGHDTIYAWHCANGAPVIEPPSMAVDADGYIADNWRELN